ncbi:glycine--tRNA ligase [Candidatus Gottesmanbacteria bacterium RIFCSPHIGHO2_01_FULL_46_14]|uniref:glycine--tRNA ligase n=2 Tax=Candidatus Gottesmaniibacteriota TaxID=1752720 RepID=A0A1F5ZQ57_9BACT|nr:MAG: glycine--tRNA ligase [Candidatus Gottesmanbacteria bacterium RIFCSPHIGHO2_01_FULL_46_14]OGG28826.1 MAG: glycine--tRNA ligase [Candidatus Gottesmanbacteria bacterium RIFCSPLOWO2_01_FULL_46_21]
MDDIVALAKRRGFIYPSSEIYGGIAGFWDYGPLGVELKRNLKNEWWKWAVQMRDDVVGLDASIIMNPKVWDASGHLSSFTDPLVECKICHKRFRADKEELLRAHEKEHNEIISWTEAKTFNLLTEVLLGVTEPKQVAYLRGEITQGVFVNFGNVVDSSRVKIPFGIAQIGKAFRNEITPGNFTFRSREFEQMELEYFIRPEEKEGERVFSYWKEERMAWYVGLGIAEEHVRFRDHEPHERAHYARSATDIEYNAPFGWSEFEGIHHRGDWDLSRHKLAYRDEETQEVFTPWVIETSGGVDRAALFFLIDSYCKEEKRTVLKLHPRLAPIKVAVFPLVNNKSDIGQKAQLVYTMLKPMFMTAWDDRGNIGKRYLSQDEAGTPWCVTIDYDTLDNDSVTVRDRDTTKQERVNISQLATYIHDKLAAHEK